MDKYIAPQELVGRLPIERGDTVLLASNVERLAWNAVQQGKIFDFELFIDLLQRRIGPTGNLLFPTYNWDFCHNLPWDYHKTRSQTGSLSQIALNRPDFIRTRHAIYSFAVWGQDAEVLFQMDDRNSFKGHTPFDFLHHKRNSKMLSLDVNLTRCFTFVHYVEEMCGVPYRFLKEFRGRYIDENRQASSRVYSMYVRYLDRKVDVDLSGLERILLEESKLIKESVEGMTIRALRFVEAYDRVADDIHKGNYQNIVQLD